MERSREEHSVADSRQVAMLADRVVVGGARGLAVGETVILLTSPLHPY